MADSLDDYPLVLRQDVIWGDMDAFGHVNNTVYFRYFEDARMAYFDRTGVSHYREKNLVGPILASTRCDFRRPLSYPEQISIAARALVTGPRKIEFQYAIYSDDSGVLVAEGDSLVVFYDYREHASCEIPDAIVAALASMRPDIQPV
jgi:acyl-CoA thioester hydrolase